MSMLEFLRHNGHEVLALSLEHLVLVAIAIGLALFIGVPLGILLSRYPAWSKPVLAFANVAQTVPSLALFGFLIPLNFHLFGMRLVGGIGPGTAIAALVLYALLPIIHNTFSGITSVDPTVRESGRAMGLTDAQLLFRVELPLAFKFIVAGVRVATVITVGTATIAAAIDAGGLGKFIFRGLRMNDNTLILAGAVPAALIALGADLGLGWVERLAGPGRTPNKRLRLAAAIVALALFVGAIATFGAGKPGERIVVGAKDFTEQVLLGELVAQTIEAKTHLPVERRFDLGGNLAHQALVSGEIDGYVEYTGTALMAILKEPPEKDPAAVYRLVKRDYAARYGVEWAEPLGFNNTFAILVRGQDAKQLHLTRISDLTAFAPKWHAGFGQDFMARPDGFSGFKRAYGLQFADRPREMDLSLTYRALRDHQVDVIAGNSTDGLIARYGLYQLADDRHYFPPYDAVPLFRTSTLNRHPEVRTALHQLAGRLSVETMRRLNFEVDGEHRAPREVVRAFLSRKGR